MQEHSIYSGILKKVIKLLKAAQRFAKKIGINNISQPEIVKEMIMADILGHKLNPVKKQHDAQDPNDSNITYEYLSCLEGKSFQFDRVGEKNLNDKVLRNKYVYCAVFDKEELLEVLRIYKLNPLPLYHNLLEKYRRSSASSRHVGITEKEIVENNFGELVYSKRSE